MTLEDAFMAAPVIAITRGVLPQEAVDVAEALFAEGVRIVEVPWNSPEPLESLRRIVAAVGDRMVCGTGTVLDADTVDRVADVGARILVSPNTHPAVIARAVERGLTPMPGFATVTEALTAYAAGARWLKLFPASTYGAAHLKQILVVLPSDVVPIAVGGVKADRFAEWTAAGARGFGLGSELYRTGDTAEAVATKAREVMNVLRELGATA